MVGISRFAQALQEAREALDIARSKLPIIQHEKSLELAYKTYDEVFKKGRRYIGELEQLEAALKDIRKDMEYNTTLIYAGLQQAINEIEEEAK